MPLFTWEEKYLVGVKAIDEQHRKIFALINRLYDAMHAGETADPTVIRGILDELSAYAEHHFGTEEELFQRYGYPQAEAHIDQHRQYREKIAAFNQQTDTALLSFAVLDFLEDWWLGHITGVDRGYMSFFREQGVK